MKSCVIDFFFSVKANDGNVLHELRIFDGTNCWNEMKMIYSARKCLNEGVNVKLKTIWMICTVSANDENILC